MAKREKDLRPLTEVAELVGANRNTLRRWLNAGKLTATLDTRGGRVVKLLDVAEVRALVGDGLKAGRPLDRQ